MTTSLAPPPSSRRQTPFSSVARNKLRSWVKTAYYHAVASVYGAAGGACDVAMANSSWTAGHLEQLWWRRPKRRGLLRLFFGLPSPPSRAPSSPPPSSPSSGEKNGKQVSFSSSTIVYPPCGVSSLQDLPLERAPLPAEVFGKRRKRKGGPGGGGEKGGGGEEDEGKLLIALAQFRPEKNQAALLRALALARRRAAAAAAEEAAPSPRPHPVLSARLALVGGVRDAADAARVEALRELARELGLAKKGKEAKGGGGGDGDGDDDGDDAVVFVTNAPRETLRSLLSSALGGLHAMVDEHFGICVVEYMAAGVVPVAHDSAGPRMDIVREEEEEEEEEEEGGGGGAGGEEEKSAAPSPSAAAPASASAGVPKEEKRGRPRSATPTGFLCSTEEEYADAISELLLLSSSSSQGGRETEEGKALGKPSSSSKSPPPLPPPAPRAPRAAVRMAAAARRRARRLFSDERFDEGFLEALRPLLARVERGCRREEEREEEEEEEEKKKRKAC